MKHLLLVIAFVVPGLVVGGLGVGHAVLAATATPAELATTLPAHPAYDPSRPTAVVVAGNHTTESSDLLGPYEVLATSGKFNVYVAAPERRPSPLFPGNLNVVPHYSFAEYDQAFPDGKVDLLVVPYVPDAEPALLEWIHAKAAAGTTVLSICVGAQVVADAGVLGGQSATSHHNALPVVEKSHPEVNWIHDRRYVDSGQFISSAGVTSGVDATLYTLGRMFGREVADQTAQVMGYPHTRFLDDPTAPAPGETMLAILPNASRLHQTEIGLVLYEGVRELEIGSILDTYPRSFAEQVEPLTLEPGIVRTRHGLDLLAPTDLSGAPSLDRLLLPGAPDANTAARVDAFAAERGLAAERIHASGAYAYDATLRDMARSEGNTVVRQAAIGLEYPAADLQLAGPEFRVDLVARPLALGLVGVGALLLFRNRRRVLGLRPVARFALHFVEMCVAMVVGMLVFMAIPGVMALPSLVHQAGMAVAMTVPMVAWMRVRGHGWRHGVEMSVGMLAPWIAVLALVALGADQALPWLAKADGAAMLLGMLAVMLLRPGHHTHRAHQHASAA